MKRTGFYLLLLAIVLSCKHQPQNVVITRNSVSMDSVYMTCIADTFIADLVVRNPDTADWWTAKCVKYLKRQAFIDTLFQQLYAQQLVAYDYYSGKPLSILQIKEIERRDDYNRDIVGKFQFYEGWFYDARHRVFIKKVYSIIFGYETYDDSGMVKGYKPMFRVVFE